MPERSWSRRALLFGSGAAVGVAATSGWKWRLPNRTAPPAGLDQEELVELRLPPEPGPDEALERLINGNKCYAADYHQIGEERRHQTSRLAVAERQTPFALVLGCADSRVPPEILFNTGLGDLFVVRVAGNIVDQRCFSVIGSIEYAIEELKIPLIFVLGHEQCGAVKAAIRVVREKIELPGAIDLIADSIRPVVEEVATVPGDLTSHAVTANVRRSLKELSTSVPILQEPIAAGRLKIIGGTYDLKTGLVKVLT